MGLLSRLLPGAGRPRARDAAADAEAIALARQEIDALAAAGRHADALAAADAALERHPGERTLQSARAAVLLDTGRAREAVDAFLDGMPEGERDGPTLRGLGLALHRVGRIAEAEAVLRRAVASQPADDSARMLLAAVLEAEGRFADAAAEYAAALATADGFDGRMGLGNCSLGAGDAPAAEREYRRALALAPTSAWAWSQLGVALGRQDRFDEALSAFARAVDADADDASDLDAFVNLAASLRQAGRVPEAVALLEAWLPRRPNVGGHISHANALLVAGRLREAWPDYEFRWLAPRQLAQRPGYPRPVWNGQPLAGRTILLHAEQGAGDTLQFVRYAARVKALGATVLLAVPEALRRCVRDLRGADRILGPGEALPDFDFHAPLLSLPRAFGTDLDTIPADVPYLAAPPDEVRGWTARLQLAGGALNVGFVWAGNPAHANDRERSLSLAQLAELAEVGGVRWYALQKGSREEESRAAPGGWRLREVGGALVDFADTAAVLSALDLVICVDTAVAHLAGALGKPVWVLVPTPADWRWLTGREDSPWYPTMRLFRQRVRGEWGEVVGRVRAALAEVVGGVRALPAAPRRAAAGEVVPAVPVVAAAGRGLPGWSAVAETRYGIMQYLPAEAGVGEGLGWYGEWLPGQVAVLTQVVRAGMTVLEVGAGVGAHALVLARLVGPAGHLLLDEPRPVHRRILRHNLGANGLGHVTILPAGSVPPPAPSHGPAPPADSPPSEPPAAGLAVDALRLRRLDLLVVDDPAQSGAVLAAGSETLWRLRPTLLLAASGTDALARLVQLARGFGYRCWQSELPWFGPDNFNRRDTGGRARRCSWSLLAVPEEAEAPPAGTDYREVR